MHAGHLYLLGRVIGMGLERPLVKRLGVGFDPTAVTTLYVGLGQVMFAAVIVVSIIRNPAYFNGMLDWLPLSFISAICCAVSFHTFIRAMKIGEVSVLTPLFATGFIFMYIFYVLAGYAALAWLPLGGVLVVTLGVAFLNQPPEAATAESPRQPWQRLNPQWVLRQPGATLMLINAFGVAVARYVDKTLAPDAEPVLYALVVNSLAVIVGLLMLGWGTFVNRRGGSTRCELAELPRLLAARWPVAIVLVIFGQGAYLLLLYSLDYFPPSVVEPVTQLGVFIAVALGGLWFAEPIRTRWLPSAMVVGGAAMLLVR
jgi:drug/metabolite transporter (DMT)-like permease